MSKVERNAHIPGLLSMSDISREAKFRRGVSRVVVATISVAMIAFGYLSLITNPLGLPMLALGLMGLCVACFPGKHHRNNSVVYIADNDSSQRGAYWGSSPVSTAVFSNRGPFTQPAQAGSAPGMRFEVDRDFASQGSSGTSVFAAGPTPVSYGLPAGARPGTRRQN